MAQSKLSVVPAEQNSSPATAHLQLKQLRQALRDAQRRAADIAAVIARAEAVGRRAAEIRADRDRLEREAARPMAEWILKGALSEPPQLSAEAQLALDQARRAADQAERDAQAVAQTLPTLQRQQSELSALIPELQKQIRETAARAVLEDARPLIQQLREQRKTAQQLEVRLLGLRDQMIWFGLGLSTELAEFGDELLRPSPMISQVEIDAAAAEWTVSVNRLAAAQE